MARSSVGFVPPKQVSGGSWERLVHTRAIALALSPVCWLGCGSKAVSPTRAPAVSSTPAPVAPARPTPPVLELVHSADGTVDVCARIDGTLRNLTQFSHVHHLYAHQVSMDGRWALVWYMDYPPRRLAIYDLRTGGRHARLTPGYGGELRWISGNRIFHSWGAGTGVRCCQVFDIEGREQFGEVYGGFELSPDTRRLVEYPVVLAGERLYVVDLATFRRRTLDVLPPDGHVAQVTWDGNECFDVTYESGEDLEQRFQRRVRLDTDPPRVGPPRRG